METTGNWRTKTLIIGGVIGALIGISTAYLLARTAEESGGGPPQITTGDAIKSAIGVVGLVRGIASLGDR
ncbi:MAG: hypothetical protein ACOC9E_02015 [Chloroflexota bacterium]